MPQMNYAVNIESLGKNFPADCHIPDLLLDFGNWLKSKRAGSVGYPERGLWFSS